MVDGCEEMECYASWREVRVYASMYCAAMSFAMFFDCVVGSFAQVNARHSTGRGEEW